MSATYDRKKQNELIMQSKSAYLKRHYGGSIRIVEDAKETREAINSAILPMPGHLAAANRVPLPSLRAERTTHDEAGNLLSKQPGRTVAIEQSGFVSYDDLLKADIEGTSVAKLKKADRPVIFSAETAVDMTPQERPDEDISILDVLGDD